LFEKENMEMDRNPENTRLLTITAVQL